jgi:hypothetical protein
MSDTIAHSLRVAAVAFDAGRVKIDLQGVADALVLDHLVEAGGALVLGDQAPEPEADGRGAVHGGVVGDVGVAAVLDLANHALVKLGALFVGAVADRVHLDAYLVLALVVRDLVQVGRQAVERQAGAAFQLALALDRLVPLVAGQEFQVGHGVLAVFVVALDRGVGERRGCASAGRCPSSYWFYCPFAAAHCCAAVRGSLIKMTLGDCWRQVKPNLRVYQSTSWAVVGPPWSNASGMSIRSLFAWSACSQTSCIKEFAALLPLSCGKVNKFDISSTRSRSAIGTMPL